MLLGFKRRFAAMVEDGTKTHTIRAKRKPSNLGYAQRSPRVGEMCHCYVDPRQKTMRLLGRWKCTRVEELCIYERGDGSFDLTVAGIDLDQFEKNLFAWRDGFRTYGKKGAFNEFMSYWLYMDPIRSIRPFVFNGQIIHWAYVARPLLAEAQP